MSAQLQQRWGNRFVDKLEAKILKSLNTICSSPYLYPVVEENMEVRKCILHKDCSMLYKIYEKEIVIICFWDNRQDPLFIHENNPEH